MLVWEKRPVEVANLLNPPFCSLLLLDTIASFYKEKGDGMPYLLSFLVLPLVLHKTTRDMLPGTTLTKMHAWLQRRSEVRVGFTQRARQLVPYTKESLIFAMQQGLTTTNENGELLPVKTKLKGLCWPNQSEPDVCRNKAQFIGRWLARAGDVSTIFAMWGIRT